MTQTPLSKQDRLFAENPGTAEEIAQNEGNIPSILTLNVSEGDISGRTGSLIFNDIDGEGFADLRPENYLASSLGNFSLTAPDENGFSSWSYQPGRSLDSGEFAIDSYLIEDSKGAEYQVNISVSGEEDPSSIHGVIADELIEGFSESQRGIVTIRDPDTSDAPNKVGGSRFLEYNGEEGEYGTFSFAGGNTSDVEWIYTLNSESELFNTLDTGDKIVEEFDIETSDGQAETITITLYGADDADIVAGAEAFTNAIGIQTENDLLKAGESFDIGTEAVAEAIDQALNQTDDNLADAIAQANAIAIDHKGSLDNLLSTDTPGLLKLTSTNGGIIDVTAMANADAEGAIGSKADADAYAIGLQDVGIATNGEGEITLDVDASARAQSDADVQSMIEADATAYGVGGTGKSTEAITIEGNPYANVTAEANVSGNNKAEIILGDIAAKAIGIENAEITSNGTSNTIGATVNTSITGTGLGSQVSGDREAREVRASAIAIDQTTVQSIDHEGSTILGNANLNTKFDDWKNMSTDEIDNLTTIGIRNASIQTSSGNDIIAGIANNTISQFEMMDENGSLNISGGGIINSTINSGAGDDIVIGSAKGDGLTADSGFINSKINTGVGNDQITGGANNSTLNASLGDDKITLETSNSSILNGGIGADELAVIGSSNNTGLIGGIGNDQIRGGSGDDVIYGGVGDDVIFGGDGADQFIYKAVDVMRGSDQIKDFDAEEGDTLVVNNNLLGLSPGAVLRFTNASEIESNRSADVDQSIIVDTMENILAMETYTNARLAYATDTGDLLFDSNGDWSQGSRTIVNLSENGEAANITSENIIISETSITTNQVVNTQSFGEASQLGSGENYNTTLDLNSSQTSVSTIPQSTITTGEPNDSPITPNDLLI